MTLRNCSRLMPFVAGALVAVAAGMEEAPARVIDLFDGAMDWKKIEAPGTRLEISQVEGVKGQSMCLDYDLGAQNSFVVAVRQIEPERADNGRFSFYMKTGDQDITLEFKLVDQSGNTFMKRWTEPATRNQWQKILLKTQDITFAWAADGNTNLKVELGEVKQVELGITGVGKGQVCIDQLVLEGAGAGGITP
jgi:hypothetical protein